MTSREQLLVARPAKRTDNTSDSVFDLILWYEESKRRGADLQDEEIVRSITLCN